MTSLHPPVATRRTRIALFGSFYRGFYVLSELLHGALKDRLHIVGVATDDPTDSLVHPSRRVWQYHHEPHEETMVAELATRNGLSVHRGSINTPEFLLRFSQEWRPELCIMATFGQRIPPAIYQQASLGFFNLHPCIDDGWPSRFAGPNPFQALMNEGIDQARIAMHEIDESFDRGRLIAYSPSVRIPKGASVVDMHKITALAAARLAAEQIEKILDREMCQ